MTMTYEGPTESLSARFQREHRDRRARLYPPAPKKTQPAPTENTLREVLVAAPETIVIDEPVELITKAVVALNQSDAGSPYPRVELIVRVCARNYGFDYGELLSSRRTADVVRPRQVAMYLAKILTMRSLPEIGRRMGDRDHTTVLHSVRKMEALIVTDTDLAERVARIREDIQTIIGLAKGAMPNSNE